MPRAIGSFDGICKGHVGCLGRGAYRRVQRRADRNLLQCKASFLGSFVFRLLSAGFLLRDVNDRSDVRDDVRRALFLLGISGVLTGLVVLPGVLGILQRTVDDPWHRLMLSWHSDIGLDVARFFRLVGQRPLSVLCYVLFGMFLYVRGHRREMWMLTGVVVFVSVSVVLGKIVIGRPRPLDQVIFTEGKAFPSGHAAFAGALAMALWLWAGCRKNWWKGLLLFFAIGMAWSRTYLCAHWLSDTLAGLAWGAGVVEFCVLVVQGRGERERGILNLYSAPQEQ